MTRIATTHTRLTKIETALVEWFSRDGWCVHNDGTSGSKIATIGNEDHPDATCNLTELARHLLDEVCA